jgi:hypothetical protein
MREIAYYIPIITLLFSIYFATKLWKHYKEKPGAIYILWWFIGVLTYSVGTFTESFHALFGWSAINFKAWYISGALLGGAPLAQGTVYLVMKKKFAHRLSITLISVVCIAAVFVALSPINPEAAEVNRLTGTMLGWQWTRAFSPFINLYALIFLVGGAVYSAWKYAKEGNKKARFLGNVYIAIGALLPGIGGTFTRMGYEEVLFVTELIGILFIYAGYTIMKNDATVSVHKVQKSVA